MSNRKKSNYNNVFYLQNYFKNYNEIIKTDLKSLKESGKVKTYTIKK